MSIKTTNFIRDIKSFIISATLVLLSFLSWAQSPTHIPRKGTEPVGFFESVENIIIFIVIPAAIVVFYIIWRRDRAKQKKKIEEEQNKK